MRSRESESLSQTHRLPIRVHLRTIAVCVGAAQHGYGAHAHSVWIKFKYTSNTSNGIVPQPVLLPLRSSRQPPTYQKSGCHQKGIQPKSKKKTEVVLKRISSVNHENISSDEKYYLLNYSRKFITCHNNVDIFSPLDRTSSLTSSLPSARSRAVSSSMFRSIMSAPDWQRMLAMEASRLPTARCKGVQPLNMAASTAAPLLSSSFTDALSQSSTARWRGVFPLVPSCGDETVRN